MGVHSFIPFLSLNSVAQETFTKCRQGHRRQ